MESYKDKYFKRRMKIELELYVNRVQDLMTEAYASADKKIERHGSYKGARGLFFKEINGALKEIDGMAIDLRQKIMWLLSQHGMWNGTLEDSVIK